MNHADQSLTPKNCKMKGGRRMKSRMYCDIDIFRLPTSSRTPQCIYVPIRYNREFPSLVQVHYARLWPVLVHPAGHGVFWWLSYKLHTSIIPSLSSDSQHLLSGTFPSTCYVYPFRQTGSLFSFYVHDICIASTSAPNSVFFDWVPRVPVFIFLLSLLFVKCGHF